MLGSARLLAGLLVALSSASLGRAQDQPPKAEPTAPETSPSPPPGRFRLGPFYLTPFFRIGNIGVDTNVFFTSVDRTRDVMVSGGPGLRIVLPMKGVQLSTTGSVEYLYFAKQVSQRRLTGGGNARFEWNTPGFLFGLEESYSQGFGKSLYEVNSRVSQEQWRTKVDLQLRMGGRFGVSPGFTATRYNYDPGQLYLGADIRSNLARDEYRAILGLKLSMTSKTALIAEGRYQQDRFLVETSRNADSDRVAGGFQIVSETRLSGRVLAGLCQFRLKDPTGAEREEGCGEAALTYVFGPATRIEGTYARDLGYSVFTLSGPTPTLLTESYGGQIDQRIVGHLGLILRGKLTRILTDGSANLVLPDQGAVVAVRDDKVREAIADLGYEFRPRFRIGVAAQYLSQRSTISYFGIKGLTVGMTVVYSGSPTVTLKP